jgi:Fe(3+) dicitrate transport protein
MDYTLRQPGGLTDAQFATDPRQARRARDWFGAPWLIPTVTLEHWLAPSTALTLTAFGLEGQRNSVGAIVAPTTDDRPDAPRRVDRDRYANAGSELRLVHQGVVAGRPIALAAGTRVTIGRTTRWRGRGTAAADFDLALTAPRTLDLTFTTTTAAAFTELTLPVADGVALVPGVRLETIRMHGEGSVTPARATFDPAGAATPFDQRRTRTTPLAALGLSITRWPGVELYGNLSQAFRPATFAELFPNDLAAVDPALRHATGTTADLGVRGTLGDRLTWDIGAFHLRYRDRTGLLGRAALGEDSLRYPNGLRTNVGDSRHQGIEALVEAALATGRGPMPRLTLFASGSALDATYTRGPQRGRQVEYAPRWQGRAGLTASRGTRWAIAAQTSYVDPVYADANNTPASANGVTGRIPRYVVSDLNAWVRLTSSARAEIGVNNLTDHRYFTRRAGGYPGPGLIPAEGRTIVAGVRLGWTGAPISPAQLASRQPTPR